MYVKKLIYFLATMLSLHPIFADDANWDYSDQIAPVIEYSNWGGYFDIQDGKLIIFEIFLSQKKSEDSNIFYRAFLKKELSTELVFKGRVVNTKTIYIDSLFPSAVEFDNRSDFELFLKNLTAPPVW